MTDAIRLIGGETIMPAEPSNDDVVNFFGPLFGRLTGVVLHSQDFTRFAAYESKLDDGRVYHFFGVEVDEIAQLPAGLIGWELADDKMRIFASRDGAVCEVADSELSWNWQADSEYENRGRIGDFAAVVESPEFGKLTAGESLVYMAGSAYADVTRQPDDAIELVEPCATWTDDFAAMRGWLCENLPAEMSLRIEHYGSTAIPGIPAKPVIDILVEVPSFAAAREAVLPLVNQRDWEYWLYADHLILIKRAGFMGKRTHHVHLATPGHRLWRGLAFRDYLRENPQTAADYAELKQALSEKFHDDREAYTHAKTDFITRVTDKALVES